MMTRISKLLSKWPSSKALLFACFTGLAALALMVAAILWPKPIIVVLGMSVAQGFGGIAFLLFLVSVAAEYRRDTGATSKP